jgi:hypothetical protein
MQGDERPHRKDPGLRELLGEIVDYAGLFPPAKLDMRAAVENYASYRAGADAWAVGRFVVPAERLEELAGAVGVLDGAAGQGDWHLSALPGPDLDGGLERIRAFAGGAPSRSVASNGGFGLRVDSVEIKAATPEEVPELSRAIPAHLTTYVEFPLDPDPEQFIRALQGSGARAKVRTGGVTQEAFPSPDALLHFLRGCVEANLPFKATAGLHHPVAGRYRLTYEPDSAVAPMFGYLNVLFATALLRRGASESQVAAALGETDAAAFHLGGADVSWREYRLHPEEIRALRGRAMVAFGSCSFREPLEELIEIAGNQPHRTPHPADSR